MIEHKPSAGMEGLYEATKRHYEAVSAGHTGLSILDLGCGDCQFVVCVLGNKGEHGTGPRYGIDITLDAVRAAFDTGRLDSYAHGDVIQWISKFDDNSFDVIMLFDFIEHLKKDSGWLLILQMKRVACHGIVLQGPEGVCIRPGEKYMEHISHWTAEEFDGEGFNVEVFDGFHGDCSAMVASWKK